MEVLHDIQPPAVTKQALVDITERYFGITPEPFDYTRSIPLFIDEVNVMSKEQPIPKEELGRFIRQLFKDYDKTYTDVFISEHPVAISEVKDTFGKVVFTDQDQTNLIGWLVFVDPFKMANWSHTCEYWFVVSKERILKRLKEKWQPDDDLILERVELSNEIDK